MHGLGNDFMVVDNTAGNITFTADQVARLAHRHFGVGFDQLLIVESNVNRDIDFTYRILNADGSEVEQCGNGARCFARFVAQKGLTQNNPIKVQTRSGVISLLINKDNSVRVDMGAPIFTPSEIPLIANAEQDNYQVENYQMGVLSMGNPHCVMLVDDVENFDIEPVALRVQNSIKLPNQANIGFMQVLNSSEIKLRVYERGSGETLACGSGACAAVVYGIKQGLLDSKVTAHLNGGDAVIEYENQGSVYLSGPAEFVFEAQIDL